MPAAEHGSRIVCLHVGAARSFIFLMCASHQGERSTLAGQENLDLLDESPRHGQKNIEHIKIPSPSPKGNARQDSLDVGGLVGREQLKEAISDKRQAQQGSTGKAKATSADFLHRRDGASVRKQGQACVPDRPTVPASPREDDATQETIQRKFQHRGYILEVGCCLLPMNVRVFDGSSRH